MKKTILLFGMIFLYSFYLNAQQSTNTQKNCKWQIGIQLNSPERMSPLESLTESTTSTWNDEVFLYKGLSLNGTTKDKTFSTSLLGSYLFKNNNFLRLKIGIDKIDIELLPEEFVESTGTYRTSDNAFKKRNDFILSPAIGRNIEMGYFNFYAGFDLPFTYYGKTEVHFFNQNNDASTGEPINSYELSGTIFKAFTIGIGNFAGFSFEIKHFSVGGEISYGFFYNKRLSESTFHGETKDLQTNSITGTTDVVYHPTISNFDMSKIKGSIMLAYHF